MSRRSRILPRSVFGCFGLCLIHTVFGRFLLAASFIAPSQRKHNLLSRIVGLTFWADEGSGPCSSLKNDVHVATSHHKSRNSNRYETPTILLQKKPRTNDPSTADDDARWQDAKFVSRNQYWVVLVDDEESIRQAVGDFLYDSGYQVTACSDAPAFQELVRQQESSAGLSPPKMPDVIVSDIRMPGMDGIALVEWIRSNDQLKHVPVILLTAKGLTEDRIVGYQAGADAYLTKPFTPEELVGMVDNAIRRAREMKGESSALADIQREMASIKQALKRKAANAVRKTDVYLTPTEREVLQLLSQGYTNAEIASERGVAPDRANRIIQKLYAETGTKTRTELVRWGLQTGYVPKWRQ